jgi:glycine cleavage system aminomethyltransferase T
MYKLSPVHHSQQELGAAWTEIDGWKIAARFRPAAAELQNLSAAVGLCDMSFQAKIEFRGRDIERVLPGLPPVGCISIEGQAALHRLTREQVLVCGQGRHMPDSQDCVHRTDRTSGFAHFLLAGPRAADLLNRLSSVDSRDSSFPDLSCRWAPLAHVAAVIARRDRRALRAYEVLASREFGEYAWRAIWETGTPLGMTAFGLETRLALEG